MINVSELNKLAYKEYLKEEGNSTAQTLELCKKITQLKKETINANDRVQRHAKYDELLGVYGQIEQLSIARIGEISYKAAKMLSDAKYTKTLASHSKALGNKNLKETELMNGIASFGLFSDMWEDLTTKNNAHTSDNLDKFVVAVDVVLDSLVEGKGNGLIGMVVFNRAFSKTDKSLAKELYEKCELLGKKATISLLSDSVSENSLFAKLPVDYKVQKFINATAEVSTPSLTESSNNKLMMKTKNK